MLRKFSVLILSLFLVASPCFAIQEINKGDVLTLEQCIDIALNNSPVVNKAKNQVRIAQANLSGAKSVWSPAIGLPKREDILIMTDTLAPTPQFPK